MQGNLDVMQQQSSTVDALMARERVQSTKIAELQQQVIDAEQDSRQCLQKAINMR